MDALDLIFYCIATVHIPYSLYRESVRWKTNATGHTSPAKRWLQEYKPGLTDSIDQPDALSLLTPHDSHYRRLRRKGAMHSFLKKSIAFTINTFSNIIMLDTPLLLSYITIISQTYKSKWIQNALLILLTYTVVKGIFQCCSTESLYTSL